MDIPRIPLGDWIEGGLTWLTSEYSMVTRGISRFTQTGIDVLNDGLMWLPEWALLALIALLCWKLAGPRLAIGAVAGLALIWNLGLWNPMIETLTLVVFATMVAVVIALPVGIAAALSNRLYRIIMPILDFMQTMPAFVYLIPAIPFFGIGSVSAIFATVIFSMPPAIRFTPLSLPTVMAGINQTIMLALSMVVIAAMIGADGLGSEVWRAIQRLRPGDGFEAGIAVVILAMLLDRLTQSLRKTRQ